MPEEAPVMNTARGDSELCATGRWGARSTSGAALNLLLLFAAYLGDQVVGDLQLAGMVALGDEILAAHDNGRRARHVVGAGDLVGARHLAGDGEGLVDFLELGGIDALAGDPCEQGLFVGEI